MDEITPLFALEAEQLLLSGFMEEAIELCNNGLVVYPEYPTAKMILAKAYYLLGKKEQSDEILSKAKSENYIKAFDRIHFNEIIEVVDNEQDSNDITASIEDIVNPEVKINNNEVEVEAEVEKEIIADDLSTDYTDEIDNFNAEFKNLIDSVVNISLDDQTDISNKTSLKIEIKEDIINKSEDELPKSLELPITNTLSKILTKNKDFFFHQEDLNDKINDISESINNKINHNLNFEAFNTSKSKISQQIITNESDNNSMKMIVMSLISSRNYKKNQIKSQFSEKSSDLPIYTETMAKIFTAQGAKDKAINIYRKLMISEPAKKDYYNTQIQIIS